MAKALRTAGMVIAGAALIATGIGTAAGMGLLGSTASATAAAMTASLAGTAAGFGAVSVFGASLSTWAAIGAGLNAIGTLLTKRPGVSTGGSPVQQTYDPSSGLPYPFGRTALAGRIVYGTVTGPLKEGNKYRLFYSVISGARIDGFESFSTNDETVSFTSDAGEGASGAYKNRMWQVRRTGAPDSSSYLRFTATGTKDTPADHGGNPPEWTPQHTFGEMAVTLTACEYDQKVYASDVKPLYVIRGTHVYDPRLDDTYPGGSGPCRAKDEATYVYSENPWLHALTWALGRYQNGALVLGIGAALAFLPVGKFVEGANVADANGWKIGGTAWSTDDKWAVLRSMAQAGGGDCFPLGGKIGCMVNAPRVSLATVEARDIVGPSSAAGTRGRRDRINAAVARYRSEAHDWEIVSAAPIVIAAHVAEDRNQQRTREIDYPYVQDLAQAGQLARYDIENSREFGPISLRLGPEWMGFEPGDALTLNVPDLGLNGQLAVIAGRAVDASTFTVTLELRSETTAKHAFALGQTTIAPPIPTPTGNDALMPGAPSAEDVTVEGGVSAGPGGSLPVIVYKVVLANQHASHVIVDYRQVSPTVGEWRSREWPVSALALDGDDNPVVTLTLDGLAAGATYQSLIRYRTVRGLEDPSNATPLPDTVTGGVDAGTVAGKTPVQIVSDAEAALQPALAALDLADQAAALEISEATAALFTPGTGVVNRVDGLEAQADDLSAGLTQEIALRLDGDEAAAGRLTDIEAEVDDAGARVSELELAQAAVDSALATLTNRVGVSMQQGSSPVANAYFGAYTAPSGVADGWAAWAAGASAIRVSAPGARFAPRFAMTAAQDMGFQQVQYLTPGTWTMRSEARLVAGNYQGGGMLVQRVSDGAVLGGIDFALDPDEAGASGVGAPGIRRFSKTFTVTAAADVVIYTMANWVGFAGGRSAKTIDIFSCDVDPVDAPVRQAQADATTALAGYSTLSASFAAAQLETNARFTSPTGDVQVAKAQAIAQSLADTNQAVSDYDLSVTSAAGGLRATAGAAFSAAANAEDKLAVGRVVLEAEGSGGAPSRLLLYSDEHGGAAVVMSAKQIGFGDNTTFDDATDTLRTVTGGIARIIAWGSPFGVAGDLLEWIGDASVALGGMTKANAFYFTSTVAPYIGGSGLPSGGGSAEAVTGRNAEQSNNAPNTTTHQVVVQLDLANVAAGDLVEARFLITQEVGGGLSAPGTWSGGWEVIEQTTAAASTAVRASGVLTIEDSGGGLLDINTDVPMDAFFRLPNRTLNGAVRYALRLWRNSGPGPTITGNGIHAQLRVQRTP